MPADVVTAAVQAGPAFGRRFGRYQFVTHTSEHRAVKYSLKGSLYAFARTAPHDARLARRTRHGHGGSTAPGGGLGRRDQPARPSRGRRAGRQREHHDQWLGLRSGQTGLVLRGRCLRGWPPCRSTPGEPSAIAAWMRSRSEGCESNIPVFSSIIIRRNFFLTFGVIKAVLATDRAIMSSGRRPSSKKAATSRNEI